MLHNAEISEYRKCKPGDYVMANVKEAGPRSLQCQPLAIVTNLSDFYMKRGEIEIALQTSDICQNEENHAIL